MKKPFSTPLVSPFYPEPPYHYEDAKIFLALFNPPESALEKMLPEPLRPSQLPLAGMLFGEQPCREIGTFMESGILIQCAFDNPDTNEDEVGVYFSHDYTDTDVAQSAGREIWGYPRKRAEISMNWDGDKLKATTVRDGVTILKAVCTLDDEGEWIDSGPNINFKLIPSVTGEGFDAAVVTAAYLKYDVKNGRSGEIELEFKNGPHDDFSMIEIETPMIGLYFDCDILVPLGKPIASLDI